VEIGGKKSMKDTWSVWIYGMQNREKNVTESRNYFLDIYDAYKDSLKIFIAKVDGESL